MHKLCSGFGSFHRHKLYSDFCYAGSLSLRNGIGVRRSQIRDRSHEVALGACIRLYRFPHSYTQSSSRRFGRFPLHECRTCRPLSSMASRYHPWFLLLRKASLALLHLQHPSIFFQGCCHNHYLTDLICSANISCTEG